MNSMKKLFLVMLLILVAAGAFAFDWLSGTIGFEVGYLPNSTFFIYNVKDPKYIIGNDETLTMDKSFKHSIYTDFDIHLVLFDYFFIGGSSKISMLSSEGSYTFFPNTALFRFDAGVEIESWMLGFRHYCMHPIMPYVSFYSYELDYEGSYEELYIRFEAKIK